MKLAWPAPERNKGPLLEVLRRVLPARGTVLEIASGTGQHAAFFATELPELVFQPTDVEPANLASIRAYVDELARPNLLAPRPLDVTSADWGVRTFDAVISANLVHIAPWEAAIGLFDGAARHLRDGGVFVLYGPFRIGGVHTAPSNEAFDADLVRRDPRWGVRDLEALVALGADRGLVLAERVPMPANNQSLVFRRGRGAKAHGDGRPG